MRRLTTAVLALGSLLILGSAHSAVTMTPALLTGLTGPPAVDAATLEQYQADNVILYESNPREVGIVPVFKSLAVQLDANASISEHSFDDQLEPMADRITDLSLEFAIPIVG